MASYLLDTQLLLWVTFDATKLSAAAEFILGDAAATLRFSTASIWEVAIKFSLRKPNFLIDPNVLRLTLLQEGFMELPITGAHAAAVVDLPPMHRDPFDRILIAQAGVENMILLTADVTIARYPGPIQRV